VGLSRLLRSDPKSGPCAASFYRHASHRRPAVAYGVCEAMRAKQIYWAERQCATDPLRFRQYLEPQAGEQVVDCGRYPAHRLPTGGLKSLLEIARDHRGGLAVIIYQPTPQTIDFGSLPLYYLARTGGPLLCRRRRVRALQTRFAPGKVWI